MDQQPNDTADDDPPSRPDPAVRDAGLETVEMLMWAAVMVVAIAGIGALLQALGTDVIGFIRDEIGL